MKEGGREEGVWKVAEQSGGEGKRGWRKMDVTQSRRSQGGEIVEEARVEKVEYGRKDEKLVEGGDFEVQREKRRRRRKEEEKK